MSRAERISRATDQPKSARSGKRGRSGRNHSQHRIHDLHPIIGNRAVQRLVNAAADQAAGPTTHRRPHSANFPLTSTPGPLLQREGSRDAFPWVGEITGTWSAALRKTPLKSPDDPHGNTIFDLPRGSKVTVTGRKGGWLHASVKINGVETSGYISRELVKYVQASVLQLDPIEIEVKIPSVPEALVTLKQAEIEKARAGKGYAPDKAQETEIGLAMSVLKHTGKYTVNPQTFRVGFVETAGTRVEISTIEDFILFVEQVEQQHPSASPAEIASEIRQLWFSDANWEILVSSEGIKEDGKHVNIEDKPDPMAERFNMDALAPRKGGKRLTTALGEVDIGHVMAGIDSSLSPFPQTFPEEHLETRGHNDSNAKLKHKTLKEASGGDSRDFTTWSGDLGQAYAEFLVARFVKEDKTAALADFMKEKAPPAELLGDIHGFIAVQTWKDIPESGRPAGGSLKISNVLRELYLVQSAGKKTYRQYVEKVSGKPGGELRPFIFERSRAFARPWFAKKAREAAFGLGRKTWFGAFTKESALQEWMEEFDRVHGVQEASSDKANKLGKAVDEFIDMLGKAVK